MIALTRTRWVVFSDRTITSTATPFQRRLISSRALMPTRSQPLRGLLLAMPLIILYRNRSHASSQNQLKHERFSTIARVKLSLKIANISLMWQAQGCQKSQVKHITQMCPSSGNTISYPHAYSVNKADISIMEFVHKWSIEIDDDSIEEDEAG